MSTKGLFWSHNQLTTCKDLTAETEKNKEDMRLEREFQSFIWQIICEVLSFLFL